MWINSIYVYIDWATYVSMNWFFRWRDSGSCCKRQNTKCVTATQYVALYAGPEFLMHFKYATILNTVFVTFMYGLALPILFGIAAFTFFNLYVCDKVLITYYFQKPPMYDNRLNDSSLRLLRWAPVFLLFFGYWCLGNKQIFENDTYAQDYSNQPTVTGHYGWPYMGPNLPLFIVGVAVFLYLCASRPFEYLFKKIRVMQDEKDWDLDENLGTYFDCVEPWEGKRWYAKTLYNQKKLDLKVMDSKELEDLSKIKKTKK